MSYLRQLTPNRMSGSTLCALIIVLAIGASPSSSIAAPIMTDENVNLTNLGEAIAGGAGTLAENFVCRTATLQYAGELDSDDFTARLTGPYASRAVSLNLTAVFNGATHKGTVQYVGTFGPDNWTGDAEFAISPSREILDFWAMGQLGTLNWDFHAIKDLSKDRFGRIHDEGLNKFTINGVPIAKYKQKSLIDPSSFRHFFVKQRVAGETPELCVIELSGTGTRVGGRVQVRGTVKIRPSL